MQFYPKQRNYNIHYYNKKFRNKEFIEIAYETSLILLEVESWSVSYGIFIAEIFVIIY